MTPEQTRYRRRRVVAAALSVVVLHSGLRLAVADARAQRDEARAEQAAATARAAMVAEVLDAAGAALDSTRASTRTSDAATRRSQLAADVAAAAAAADRQLVANGAAEAFNAAGHLDQLHALIASSTSQIDDLRACLDGVAAASAAADDRATAAAVGALDAVEDVCRRAEAASGPVDPTVRFAYDFPDPFVVAAEGGYLAYATNSAGGAVQLLRSGDLQTWSFVGTALEAVPPWAIPGHTWAPSVVQRPEGWVLYYTVRHRASGRQCISAAVAPGATGPFVDDSAGPVVCELEEGGSIDPSPFVAADGSLTLLWKAEGETAGGGASIRSAPLAPDGRSVVGPTAVLAVVDQAWEGRTIEGPAMVSTTAGIVLLYSANRWDSPAYAIGAAVCASPAGPCQKVGGPLLASAGPMVGPGGAEAFVDGAGAVRVAFHAWQGDDVGYPQARYLHIGELLVEGGRLRITV